MKLLTKALEQKLIKNYQENQKQIGKADFAPVVKFFGGNCTWLVTEYDPESRMFFGLADLGMGHPELGWISRDELEELRFPPFRLPVERDLYSTYDKPLSYYLELARKERRIVE